MEVLDVLARCGGLADRAALIAATSRADVDRALVHRQIVRWGPGRYSLPDLDQATAIAHGMRGVLSLSSAALVHGWPVKDVPERPLVVVPRKRRVPQRWRDRVQLHRCDLHQDDLAAGIATGRELTLTQCLRSLPDDEALAIADSALRAGEDLALARAVREARGPGAAKVRRIAAAAHPGAANPFESCLRAITLTVPGLACEPQVVISTAHCWARPDLVDVRRRLVIEAESWEFHGTRAGFDKDVRRYTLLTAEGWRVLRFTWPEVMRSPEAVRAVLCRAVGEVDEAASWPRVA